jgi:hypothetical protein
LQSGKTLLEPFAAAAQYCFAFDKMHLSAQYLGCSSPFAMTSLCARCACEIAEGDEGCAHCGAAVAQPLPTADTAPIALPPLSTTPVLSTPMFSMESDLIGIGGWLILPVIGLAISPFLFLHGVYTDLRILFGSQFQTALATRPALAGLILFEAINNTILFAATICLNILLYRKKRAFPTYMTIYLGAQFVLGLVDHLAAVRFNPDSEWTAVARGFFAAIIWIPYFLRSRRVEVTFVH